MLTLNATIFGPSQDAHAAQDQGQVDERPDVDNDPGCVCALAAGEYVDRGQNCGQATQRAQNVRLSRKSILPVALHCKRCFICTKYE